MFFNKLLDSIDLFKKPLFLRVANQEKLSTPFGLLISLLIYICLGYFFSQSDFFLKLNPTIIQETIEYPSPPLISYKDRPFSFAIKNDLSGERMKMDSSIFSMDISALTILLKPDGTSQFKKEPKTWHYCNSSDTPDPNELKMLGENFCLDNSSFELEGFLGALKNSLFQIQIYQCQNSTMNNNSCRSPEEIQAFFNMKSLSLYYRNTVLQLKNYESPSVETTFSSVYKLEAKLNRLVVITLQKAEILTQQTVVGSNLKRSEPFLFQKEKSEIGLSITTRDPVISVVFFSSNDVLTANRTYQSLTEAFAVLGGLFSILMIFGNILSKVDNTVYVTTLLMNFLYSFQQHDTRLTTSSKPSDGFKIEEIQNPITESITQKHVFEMTVEKTQGFTEAMNPTTMREDKKLMPETIKTMPQQEAFKLEEKHLPDEVVMISSVLIDEPTAKDKNSGSPKESAKVFEKDLMKESVLHSPTSTTRFGKFFRKLTFGQTMKKENSKTIEEFIKLNEKNQQIRFNIMDFIKLMIKRISRFSLNFKEKLYIRAHKVFETEIDIVKILQRIQDIEKLKYLLFDDQQLLLFDMLEKPMIFAEEEEEKMRQSFSPPAGTRRESVFDPKLSKVHRAFDYYVELGTRKDCNPLDKKLFHLIDKRFKAFKKILKQ